MCSECVYTLCAGTRFQAHSGTSLGFKSLKDIRHNEVKLHAIDGGLGVAPVSLPPPPTEHGTVPRRSVTRRPARSLKASWPRPPPFPPHRSPDTAAAAGPHSLLSARPQSREGERDRESKPHADCLLEPGSPLRSLCSLHASAAAMTAAAALPLLKLLLLLHTVHSLLPIHRYRRPQSARPFIDQRSRLPLRCDRRTRPTGGVGPPFLPS